VQPLVEDLDVFGEDRGRQQERAPTIGQLAGKPHRDRSESGEVDR
jgi:hypothetical protein